MQYFIFPILMLIYFELLGRWLMMKFNKEALNFSFIIGFLALMALYYLTAWPITALNQPFNYIVIYSLVVLVTSVILIIKDFKKISFKFNKYLWLAFIIILIIECIISYNRALGDPHGFDVLYYLNMISFNIGNQEMNSLHPHFGTYPNTDVQWITYVFQSFYYFVEVVIYLFRNILNIFKMSFENLPAYTWGFQILAHAIWIATSLECLKEFKIKSKLLNISLVILLCLFMGNFYYNNVLGFIGNNLRMSIHAISILFLFRYLKDNDKIYRYLFYIAYLGMCAVSSTGTFAFAFVLFGLFFYLFDKEKNLLKEYAIVMFVPLLNIVVTQFSWSITSLLLPLIFVIIVYLLNDIILKIYQNKYIRIATIVIIFLFMTIMSYRITNDILSTKVFFNNYSEWQDMSWDYFTFYDLRHYIFNLIILIPFFIYIIKNKNEAISIVAWCLIICVYNPLVCTFMNKINWVYYRTYDILINQYTIILYIYFIYKLKNNYKKIISICLLCLSIILALIQMPRYYHESFIPSDDYNHLYKIDNTELEVIRNVKAMIKEKDIDQPKIITSTFWMPSFIENSEYLIGKERRYNYANKTENSWQLYLIFYPTDGWDNFRPSDIPDYDNVSKYLAESDYNIVVVDYGQYVDYKGEFISLASAIEADGKYMRNEYSTNKYAVYYLKDSVK